MSEIVRRVLRRKLLVLLAAACCALILAHAIATFVVGRRLDATVDRLQQRWGDLSLSSLAPPEVDKARNRAPVLRAAIDVVALDRDERQVVSSYATFDRSERDESRIEELDGILERHRLSFELLAAARERPQSNWYIPYEKGISADLPPLLDFINLSRLNVARTVRALDRGDGATALAAVEQGLAMTDSLSREPVLIVQLIRVACDRLNLGALRELLARADLDPSTLSRLQEELQPMADADPVRLGVLGEMKSFYHEMDRIEHGQSFGPGDPWIQRSGLVNWLLRPAIRDDTRFYLEQMSRTLERMRVAAHARDEWPTPRPRFYHFISRTALPNLENAVLRGELFRVRGQLARSAIALRRYRADHGGYPGDLEALVPDYLDAVPIDPFSGAPPVYAVEGRGFRLASTADGRVRPLPQPTDEVLRWEDDGG